MSSNNNNPREQQLLVRTVQQEVELKALRAKVKMLEAKCKNNNTHHNNDRGSSPDPQPSSSVENNNTTTNNNNSPTKKSSKTVDNNNTTTTTKLMTPIMAEEILPDYNDGLPVRPATHHHSALVLGVNIYVFGGQCAPDARGFSAIDSDVWQFNLEKRIWRRMEVQGGVSRQRGRSRHSAVGYKGSMFVYGGNHFQTIRTNSVAVAGNRRGGRNNNSNTITTQTNMITSNALHTFSPASGRWFDVPMSPPGEPLADHTAVCVQDTMFIFGGINASGRNSIVRGIDLAQRTWLDANRLNPQIGRAAAAASSSSTSYQEDDNSNNNNSTSNSMADVPAPRSGHSAVTWHSVQRDTYDPSTITSVTSSMVVFGGSLADNVCANDCFLYNYRTNMWSRLFCGGQVPEPRCEHSASCAKEFMFVCGGVGANEDLHTLGGGRRKKRKSKKGGEESSSSSDDDDEEEEEEEEEDEDTSSGDSSSDDDDDDDETRKRKRELAAAKKRRTKAKEAAASNRPRLFNDVYALNLAQSVWQKIEISTICPSMLSQCGHASLLYQSPENYVAMLTFGGITVERTKEEEEEEQRKRNLMLENIHQGKKSGNVEIVENKKSNNSNNNNNKADGGAPLNSMVNNLLSSKRVQHHHHIDSSKKSRRHRKHHHNNNSDTEEDTNNNSNTQLPTERNNIDGDNKNDDSMMSNISVNDNDDQNPIVGGGIFVMRLMEADPYHRSQTTNSRLYHNESTHNSRNIHRPTTPVMPPSNGENNNNNNNSNNSRPTSARLQRPTSAASSSGATGSARRRYGGGGGGGGRPTSAMSRNSNNGYDAAGDHHHNNNNLPRWITTGSHVLDREAALKAKTKPHPPSKRSDEEIQRFFRNLNDRTEAQRVRMREMREQYLKTEEPARFASAEDQEASVSRLYFDAIQHKEQTYADLEEQYDPGNPVKVLEPGIIGDTIERLYSNTSPTSASRQRSRSPDGSSSRPTSAKGGRKDNNNGKGKDDDNKKKKTITPQEEKDAVQRLYYLSLEFKKRREQELIDKHLFAGYKSPKKVDPNALVERLYNNATKSKSQSY